MELQKMESSAKHDASEDGTEQASPSLLPGSGTLVRPLWLYSGACNIHSSVLAGAYLLDCVGLSCISLRSQRAGLYSTLDQWQCSCLWH